MAHDSQIVRAKENLKLSYGWLSQRQASLTNQRITALRPPIKAYIRAVIESETHRRAIKDETIAINYDWLKN